ncbi:MAG: cadherin-like domain-containing protein, partial [Thermoguttaceae bacterium]|nr:cadherin-like domain-containing protein [Thermoguttaceae bacterium]
TFTITVKTDQGGSTTFDWTITVDPVNDAPVITVNDDVFEEGEGGVYQLKRELTEEAEPTVNNTINLGTVSDIDNVLATANITYYSVSGTGGHVWTSNADDAQALFSSADFAVNGDNELIFTYTLAPHVHGYADIEIQINDLEKDVDPTNLDSNTVKYRINVASVNDAPVAEDVAWSVSISSLLRGTASFDFNAVISDIDNDDLTITALSLGETAIDVEGTPTAVTVGGIDLWATYDSGTKTLTLDAPDGVDLTVLDKQSLALAYTVNDNSPLGELTADGTGTVSFTMYAQDDDATYDEHDQDVVHTIDVLANDRPIWEQEGKTFTLSEVSALSDESAGSVAIVDGKVEYTQAQDYRGTVTFTYTIVNDDDPTETATATVTILVKAINAAPTADVVGAQMEESQSGDDMVQLNFADAVADRESPDENLTITINEATVVNGTLVGNDGNALPVVDGVISFKATDAVYFKPNQYYNGETTIPYTVTDSLDDLAGFILVDGETAKTAASNVIVVVTSVGTTPTVELEDASANEIASGAEPTTIQIGTASMPEGAEGLRDVSALSKSISAHIAASDTQDSLITDYSFALDTETGAITFTYTPIEHVWGTQTFDVTVTSVEYGTKTVEWTLTINPVNDTPEVQIAAIGSGAKESEIQVSFDVVDVETPTADLTYTLTTAPTYGTLYKDGEALAVGDMFTTGNAITYRVYDGAPEGITGDSFVYAVTDRGADAGLTDADSITVENLTGTIAFNQAPVINNYVGTKTVDTTSGAQSGSWLLFNLSDVVDPEGEPITKANITLSGDAAWVGDSVYISYNFDQGKFGSKEATVTITDPVDASITSVYEFNLAAVASVGLHLSETRAATATNPLYVDFANNTVSTTDSPLDVATIIGEGPYNVTYNFSAGDDAQEMGTHSRPVYWQIPDGAAASDFWTTEPNEYPVYVNGVKQSGKYWDTTKAGLTSAVAPEDTTGFVTSYPKMVATAGTDANNPVTVTVTEDGKMTMQIAPYAPALDLDGSVTISNGENSVTIPVAILNAYESPTTFDLQYFVSTKAFTNTATVDRDGWFNEDQSQMDAQLLDSVDTQVTDSTGAALYWDPDCIGEDYWTTTPNEYPVYYGGNQQQDEETGLPLYWDTTKVSVDNNTTNVRPSSSRDRYPVMERSQASVAKKTSDIAYGSDHYLNIFASDSWNQGNLRLNSVCTLAFKVNFGAPVTLKDTTSPASMGTNAADWNEDHSEVTFLMINLNTSADGDGPGIVEDSYKMLLAAKYAYTSDFSSGTPTVTIELQAIQRNMDSGVTNLNT